MSLNIAEILDALPEEPTVDDSRATDTALRELMAKLSRKPVPMGSLHRRRIGDLHTRIGVGYLFYWIRSWFKSAGEQQRDLMETNLRAAFRLLDDAERDRLRKSVEYCEHVWKPRLQPGVFDFADGDDLRHIIDLLAELTKKRYTRGRSASALVSRWDLA